MKLVNRVFDFWVFFSLFVCVCVCRVRVRAPARVLGSYLCSKDLIRDIHWVQATLEYLLKAFA